MVAWFKVLRGLFRARQDGARNWRSPYIFNHMMFNLWSILSSVQIYLHRLFDAPGKIILCPIFAFFLYEIRHSIRECYRLPRCSAVLFPVVVFISTFISGCWTRKSFGLTLTSDEFKPWITILKQSGFRNSSFGKLGSGYSGNSDTLLVSKTGSRSKISKNIEFSFKYLLTILFIE